MKRASLAIIGMFLSAPALAGGHFAPHDIVIPPLSHQVMRPHDIVIPPTAHWVAQPRDIVIPPLSRSVVASVPSGPLVKPAWRD